MEDEDEFVFEEKPVVPRSAQAWELANRVRQSTPGSTNEQLTVDAIQDGLLAKAVLDELSEDEVLARRIEALWEELSEADQKMVKSWKRRN